jgi:hypothetical protein
MRVTGLLAGLLVCGAVAAGTPSTTTKPTPELAPDPTVTAILDALGDHSGANLPPIKTVGEWNETTRLYGMETTGPVGRDFCAKMVWAAERKRGLYCGANHGSPHRLNDVWEYDLPSNTWVMLFAPDPNKPGGAAFAYWVKQVAAVKNGVLMTKRGAPLDPWHTWWQLAYVPEMKALLWANPLSCHAEAAKVLAVDSATLYKGPPFWLFYPEEKTWKPLKTEPPFPPKVGGAQAMEYIPDLKGPVFYTSNWFSQGMWLYDPKTNAWKDLKPNGGEDMYHGKNSPRSEAVMVYDPENRTIVAQSGKATYHYDVAANQWNKVLDEPDESDKVPRGHDARTPFGYDPAAKVCLLYSGETPEHVWAYRVKDRIWAKVKVSGPAGPQRRNICCFDPERNVLVINDGATVWVYRHKKAVE